MPATAQPARFFRYSQWDALPALGGVANVALLLWTFAAFPTLSWPVVIVSFTVLMSCYCWNLQCVSHNFIHNPYFTNRWLNRGFGLLETLAIGMPHVLYHHYHLNHHAGDNDAKGPDGTTRDWSSIYRYGDADQPEAFWKYCLFSYFRVEVGPVLRVAFLHGTEHILQTVAETLLLGSFWAFMLWADWRYFAFFYFPSYFLGWVISYAEGYLEHYGAQPGNYYANSVSSYNTLYNLLWFNNGYHQEHHWDPKMHWTRMSQLHAEIRPQLEANQTRVLTGPHLTALLEDWLKGGLPVRRDVETNPEQRQAA